MDGNVHIEDKYVESPSTEKAIKVTRELKNNRSPGDNDMLKSGGDQLQEKIYKLSNTI